MRFSRNEPGLVVSAIAHASLLAAALVVFSDAKKFEDAQETVPVEVVTDQQFNQIMKGDETAHEASAASRRVDKIADMTETKPQPPLAEAKRDIPAPPPPLKRLQEPEDEDKPEPSTAPKRVAALPPTPQPPARPASQPQPRLPPQPQAKTPPEPEKDAPADVEVVKPKPPIKQKPAAKPKDQPRLEVKEVAKLLERASRDESDEKKKTEKAEKPAKPKSSDATAPKSKFSAASIADLLSHEAPQRRASTGKEATRTASLGAPTASAPHMSPSLQAQIDGYTIEHYRKCWAAALSTNALAYVPRVELRLTRDGALEEPPRLVNPSSNPVERSRGEQALAAVRRCSPMPIPVAFAPYYDYWRVTELHMEEEM